MKKPVLTTIVTLCLMMSILLSCDKIEEILSEINFDPSRATDTLETRTNFLVGHYLISRNGRYEFKLQEDSNMTLVDLSVNKLLWDSGTTGTDALKLRITNKGEMRLYRKGGKVLWKTDTINTGKDNYLRINDDGSLALYGDKDKPVWKVQGNSGPSTNPEINVKNEMNYFKKGEDVTIEIKQLPKDLATGDIIQMIVVSEKPIEEVYGWNHVAVEQYQEAFISLFYKLILIPDEPVDYLIGPADVLLVTLVQFRGKFE